MAGQESCRHRRRRCRRGGGAEQPRGRCVQITQQPVADSVVRDGLQRAVHIVEQLLCAGALALGAVQRDRIDGGEPADRPAQVDIGFEHRPARPAEVNGDGPVADRGRDRPAQRGQQDFLDRHPKPAPRVVDLGGLRDGQCRGQSRQVGHARRFGDLLTRHPQVRCRRGLQPEIAAFDDRRMGGQRGAALGPLGPRCGDRLQRNLFTCQPLPERGEDVGEQDFARRVVADDRRAR